MALCIPHICIQQVNCPVFPSGTVHKLKKGRQGRVQCDMIKITRNGIEGVRVLSQQCCDGGVDDVTRSLHISPRRNVNTEEDSVRELQGHVIWSEAHR